MAMITGATSGTTIKNGTLVLKTPGKDGITFQKQNSYVRNTPTLNSINAKFDGKFDDALYYTYPSGTY
jgi:hypothetical protein